MFSVTFAKDPQKIFKAFLLGSLDELIQDDSSTHGNPYPDPTFNLSRISSALSLGYLKPFTNLSHI